MIKLAASVPTYCCKRFTIKVRIYVKMKMRNKLFAFLLLWNLLSLVFGEMDAETVYVSLSRRIDDLYFEEKTIRNNVSTMVEHSKTVEESVRQLMSAIQQCTQNSKSVVPSHVAVEDLKESINFQAMALRKTLTTEKTLSRESVKQLDKKFYELREHMQKQMSDFFETVTKQFLAANNSIEATSTEIKNINDVVRKISVDKWREIEIKVEEKCSVSDDLRRGLEELKRDLKAEIDQNYLELLSILVKGKDCLELRKAGNTISGVYTIWLWKSKKTVDVYCDMDTDGGGWTVFQNRFDGSVDFYRSFVEYKSGFGRLDGEFWLGLSNVQELTARVNGASELRLDMSAADGDTAYKVYKNFYLSGGKNYILNIDPLEDDALGLSWNSGESFSTYDRDDCAVDRHSGWWFYNFACTYVNLNGRYATPGQDGWPLGMYYSNFKEVQSLKTSKMMFRRTT